MLTAAIGVPAALSFILASPTRDDWPAIIAGVGIYSIGMVLIALLGRAMRQARDQARRRAQELNQERARWQGVVEGIADEVWVCDAHGRISLVNLPAITAMRLPEFTDRTVQEVYEEVDILEPDGQPRPPERAPLLRSLRGEVVRGEEIMVHRRTGTCRHRQFSCAPTRDGDGKIIGAVAIVRDVTDLRRAERSLQESTQRIQGMFHNAAIGIVEVDATDAIIAANDRLCQFLGYSREELLHMTVHELTAPEDRERSDEVNARVHTGAGVEGYEKRYLKRDGSRLWVHVTVSGMYDAQGHFTGSIGTVEDITNRMQAEEAMREVQARLEEATRKRTEEALRMSEQEFSSLAEAVPQIVWATRPDGWNVYFNQQWVDYTGMTMEESYGHGWNTPFHPDDKHRAWVAWQRATQHNEPYSLECRLRRADGVYRWWLIRGSPMRGASGEILKWFGTCTDIEDIKRAEAMLREANDLLEQRVDARTAELRESEERFRTLANAIPQLAWVANSDGYITWYNDKWYEYTGTTPEQMKGWGWQSVHKPSILPEVMQRWAASIASGQPFEMVFPLRAADGQFRLFLTRVQPLKDGQENVVQWFGTNTDVDQIKRAEEDLRRTAYELKRSNYDLEQFAYVSSHDLQEPLRMVSNFMQLLKKEYEGKLDQRADQFIAFSVEGAVRMQELVKGLLEYSRVGRGQDLRRIDLNQSVREALYNLQSSVTESGAQVFCEPLPEVIADKTQLTQVFQNLIGNAIKFHKEGCVPQIRIIPIRRDGAWRFDVQDNGIGFDPKHADSIFRVYRRLHPRTKYPGTGIGLALCKKIIERHGGSIWAAASEGEGATFSFTIPDNKEITECQS